MKNVLPQLRKGRGANIDSKMKRDKKELLQKSRFWMTKVSGKTLLRESGK
jgi:hypothetical protein